MTDFTPSLNHEFPIYDIPCCVMAFQSYSVTLCQVLHHKPVNYLRAKMPVPVI